MLFSKRRILSALCFIAMVMLLAFSGCSGDGGGSGGTGGTKESITIKNIDPADLPSGSKYFSLSVVLPGDDLDVLTSSADIANLPLMSTILIGDNGEIPEGFALKIPAPTNTFSVTFSMFNPKVNIPDDYILILGASPDQNKDPSITEPANKIANGRMYITGTSSPTTDKKTVNIGSDDAVIEWSEFLDNNGGQGWKSSDLITTFYSSTP